MGCPRDPNTNGSGDGPGGTLNDAEPERPSSAEIESVVASIDLQGCSQAPGTSRQIKQAMGLAVPLHELDAFKRLKCPDQNRRSNGCRLAYHIQHEMRAIVKENVSMTRGEIHRADARRWTTVVMTRWIARGISFGFYDAAAESSLRQFVDYNFSDEEARQGHRAHGKFRAP